MIPLAFLVALVTGCGGGEEPSPVARDQPPVGAPAITATPSPAPTPEATRTASPDPTPVEDQEGGAGDEEAPRIPVTLRVGAGGVTPREVQVPAFFPIELTVRNDLPEAVTVRLGEVRVRALAGSRARGRHPGLRPGEHEADAGPAGSATIVAGAEPGP